MVGEGGPSGPAWQIKLGFGEVGPGTVGMGRPVERGLTPLVCGEPTLTLYPPSSHHVTLALRAVLLPVSLHIPQIAPFLFFIPRFVGSLNASYYIIM